MSTIKKPRSLHEAVATRTRRRRTELKAEVAAAAILAPNDLQPTLVIHRFRVDALRPPKVNARTVDPVHVAGLVSAMKTFTQVAPLIVCPDKVGVGEPATAEILDGVIRWEAGKALGFEEIACVVLDIPRGRRAALRVRLNREQEKGDWDLAKLGEVLIELDALEIDLGITGLEAPEIDMAMTLGGESIRPAERVEDLLPVAGPAVTRPGDLFRLGQHRLYCGDALEAASYAALLGEQRVGLVISDAPFNRLASTIGGKGKVKHGNFAQASGEMSEEAFAAFCRSFIARMVASARPGTLFYLFMDWQHLVTLIQAAEANGLTQKNLIVWDKGHGGMGGLYRSAHELVPLFKLGDGESCDNVRLGRYGRDRSNVVRYAGANTLGSSARAQLKNHPTPKSVECIADFMLDASALGDGVLDSFVGSGTVFIAAERTRRCAYGIELSPTYCDVAIRRWEKESGEAAILEASGETFAEVAARRAREAEAPAPEPPAVDQARDTSAGSLPEPGPARPRIRVKAGTA